MIRNNLAALLAERSIRITTAAMETHISRNTITSTAQNDGKMIQLETVNKLCQYLNITPTDFFSYLPYDVEFDVELNSMEHDADKMYSHPVFDGLLTKKENGRNTSFDLTIVLTGKPIALRPYNANQQYAVNVLLGQFSGGDFPFERKWSTDPKLVRDFEDFWNRVPAGFQADIQQLITSKVTEAFWKEYSTLVPENGRSHFSYWVNQNWFHSAEGFDENSDDEKYNTKVQYPVDNDDLPF